MSLQPGALLFQRYRVVRSLKAGGMGAVYEGIDRNLADTPCAIKEVLLSALQGPDAEYVLRSFASEMKALANLNHPNIPRVRDFFEEQGKRYIVMDLVQGQALDDELAEHLRVTGQPMDPAVAALDMVALLETLQYLHSGQPPLVHRDVKPANLIRDQRSGQIRLVDFGIARSVDTQRIQTQVGTPGFCAPEQMAGRAEPRSDLFSVGATLCYLVTGKMAPFYAYQALSPELPNHPGLAEIITKATEVRAQDRYASAAEMAEALKQWLREQSSPATPSQAPPQAPPPPRFTAPRSDARPAAVATRIDSNPWMMGVLIALLLLVALGLFLSTPRIEEPVLATASPTPVAPSTLATPMAAQPPLAARPRPASPRSSASPPARPPEERRRTPARPAPVREPAVAAVPAAPRPRLDEAPAYPERTNFRPVRERARDYREHRPAVASQPTFPGPESGLTPVAQGLRWARFRREDGPTTLMVEVHWTRPDQSTQVTADGWQDQSFRQWLPSNFGGAGEICRYTGSGPHHRGIHIKPGMVFKLHSDSMTDQFDWPMVLAFINASRW